MKLDARRIADIAVRAVLAGAIGFAACAAYKKGGGDDPVPPPPAPRATASASAHKDPPKHALGGEAYQVKLRLTDALGDARIDAPNLVASKPALMSHWRRMAGPWTKHAGEAGQMALTIALRTSRMELQWAVPLSDGRKWAPDARTWNMNEGSFDQRDAIFAPTPATVSFRTTIPQNARLEFSPAVLMPNGALAVNTTVFTVSVVDASAKEHDAASFRVAPRDVNRWTDAIADLSPFAGQTVELRLKTTTDKALPNERALPPPAPNADDPNAPPPPQPMTMALALWGNPLLKAKAPTQVPYNVLWIVVDALRSDVVAALHDDEEDTKKAHAAYPPLDAQLPKIPGLTPNIDDIAMHGVRFVHGYSAGAWTRPGTISMLSGMRSSELGLDTLNWVLSPEAIRRFYDAGPPLLPLLLRQNGVFAGASINNFFMVGPALVAVDFGFERLADFRYRTRDTAEIAADSVAFLKAHAHERFMLFANFNSPHDPYDPPPEYRKRVPPPPAGPSTPQVRLYMAEAAKDDDAIGVLLKTLDDLDLRKNTILVVTADHGETLSQAHAGISSLDGQSPVRFHHAVSCFDETTKVPILVSLPGVADGGRMVKERVRNIDIVPTILEMEGLDTPPKVTGKSMMPLIRGEKEADERVVVSEGRAMRAVIAGKWRLLVREKEAQFVGGYGGGGPITEELFDLEEDPGERHNVAKDRPDVVAEMRARLQAALANQPVFGSAAATAPDTQDKPTLHVRFAGGGKARRVSGTLTIAGAKSVTATAVGAPKEAIRVDGGKIEIALTTAADDVVGLDLKVDPPGAPIAWELYLDDQPWPQGAVFTGPFGLAAHAAKAGVTSDEARAEIYSPQLPEMDPLRDLGMFVTRDRRGEATSVDRGATSEAMKEAARALEQAGYAHGSSGTQKK